MAVKRAAILRAGAHRERHVDQQRRSCEPLDAATTSLVALLLPTAAALGMWRPLRKAATTDPASELRQN